jgi:hypothetical protein
MSFQPFENKALSWDTTGKLAPILAEIMIRKSQNLIPYQRRAKHAGQCGVEVEGGQVPTHDWFLNVQILTSGGFR